MPEPSDLRDMTAQPVELHIDGKDYKLSPLTFRDLGELQQWAINQHQRRLFKNLDAISNKQMQQEAIRIFTQPISQEQAEVIMTAEMATVEGTAYTFWLMARQNEPNLTLKDISALLTNENMNYIVSVMEQINTVETADPKEEGVGR